MSNRLVDERCSACVTSLPPPLSWPSLVVRRRWHRCGAGTRIPVRADTVTFELEAFGPGQSCSATSELTAGTYALFCIVEAGDGETHFAKGMKSTLVVS